LRKEDEKTDDRGHMNENLIKSFAGSRGGFSKEPLAAGGEKWLK